MRKISAFILCMALIVGCLAGCGQSYGGSVSGNGLKIFMTVHDDTDTFLMALTEAMNNKAASAGVVLDAASCNLALF